MESPPFECRVPDKSHDAVSMTMNRKSKRAASASAPYRAHGRGSFVIDRRFRVSGGHVVRLVRASGTTDTAVLAELHVMLDNLVDLNRTDVIEALHNKTVTIADVHNSWRRQELGSLSVVSTLTLAEGSILKWLESAEVSAGTVRDYRAALRRLLKAGDEMGIERPSITDLPAILRSYRESARAAGTQRVFNLTRAMVQAYLTHSDQKHGSLWSAVSSVRPLKVIPKAERTARAYGEVVKLMGDFSDSRLYAFWFMAHTGANIIDVYERRWEIHEDRIVIAGQKTHFRDRIVPLTFDPAQIGLAIGFVYDPSGSQHPFYGRKESTIGLKRAHGSWRLAEARNSFAHWLECAGVQESRSQFYMGQSTQSGKMIDRYRRHEVLPHLAADAKLLKDWMRDQAFHGE